MSVFLLVKIVHVNTTLSTLLGNTSLKFTQVLKFNEFYSRSFEGKSLGNKRTELSPYFTINLRVKVRFSYLRQSFL